jgi:hypothetical protein
MQATLEVLHHSNHIRRAGSLYTVGHNLGGRELRDTCLQIYVTITGKEADIRPESAKARL